jgi:hypothetical protein
MLMRQHRLNFIKSNFQIPEKESIFYQLTRLELIDQRRDEIQKDKKMTFPLIILFTIMTVIMGGLMISIFTRHNHEEVTGIYKPSISGIFPAENGYVHHNCFDYIKNNVTFVCCSYDSNPKEFTIKNTYILILHDDGKCDIEYQNIGWYPLEGCFSVIMVLIPLVLDLYCLFAYFCLNYYDTQLYDRRIEIETFKNL